VFVGEPEGKRSLEDVDVGGWIILKWTVEIGWVGMDCINLAQVRYRWHDNESLCFIKY
jgi:hypothetical protein